MLESPSGQSAAVHRDGIVNKELNPDGGEAGRCRSASAESG
jgi:hypothetical protein